MSFFDFLRFPQAKGAKPVTTAVQAPYTMERIGDSEAEIKLYGDIVAERPKHWWTGEALEGNFIILSEFLADLQKVEDVSKLTVRIHSAGGNAYEAIAIHNRLKELKAEVTVIVDGIAMSGGSLIMCAGNKVKVNPGSLVMIHKCWSYVWDAMNADELRKQAESNDAIDRAQAAIYHAKTGLSESELLTMMGNETYMTGQEAVDKGFADELMDGEAPDIAASADRRTLFYCGQPVWATQGRPLPNNIPISAISSAAAVGIDIRPAMTGNEGGKIMAKTLDELRAKYPDLCAQLETEARASAVAGAVNTPVAPATAAAPAAENPADAERKRIQAIDQLAPCILDKQMVEEAKYGENACTAEQLAYRVLQMQASQGQAHLASAADDFAASGIAQVQTPAAPAAETDPDSPDAVSAQARADVAAFQEMKEVR